jgi:hypothetical protein
MVISGKYYAQRILAVVRKNYVFKLFSAWRLAHPGGRKEELRVTNFVMYAYALILLVPQ